MTIKEKLQKKVSELLNDRKNRKLLIEKSGKSRQYVSEMAKSKGSITIDKLVETLEYLGYSVEVKIHKINQ